MYARVLCDMYQTDKQAANKYPRETSLLSFYGIPPPKQTKYTLLKNIEYKYIHYRGAGEA